MQEIRIGACQRKKRIKKGNIKERDTTWILIEMKN